jgi:hypothetical protein
VEEDYQEEEVDHGVPVEVVVRGVQEAVAENVIIFCLFTNNILYIYIRCIIFFLSETVQKKYSV